MINDASFTLIFYKVNPKSRFIASVGRFYSFFRDSNGFSRAIGAYHLKKGDIDGFLLEDVYWMFFFLPEKTLIM